MSVTAAVIFDRITGLEQVYGAEDYAEALVQAAMECDKAMGAIEANLLAHGWRQPQ